MGRWYDDVADDFCFVCKDGGDVRVCDFKNCLKAYHPRCVGKEEDFMNSSDQFTCDWHKCATCKGNALYECFCCPSSSTCEGCLGKAEFIQVKGSKGFCSSCLKMAIVTEEDADDEQARVVFTGTPENYDILFKDYWVVLKEKERFTLLDLQVASIHLKRKNCKEGRDSDECHKTDGKSLGNGDAVQTFLPEPMDRPSEVQVPVKRKKSNKKTYVGWASKELTEFLSCIGKDSTKPLDHYRVTQVVKEYIQQIPQENTTTSNPSVPSKLGQKENKKKKTVECDAILHSLFGKKKVKFNMIHNLLETHLVENAISEDESDGSGDDCGLPVKKKSRNCLEPKVLNKVPAINKRWLAALNRNNLNLIYLRRTLVVKLVSELDTFQQKVVGCLVRVKNDVKSYTYMMTKKHYQLGLVTGIKKSSEEYKIFQTDQRTDILLCVSSMWDDVKISALSDEDLDEDECNDLLLSAKKDDFKRPTVAELEEKEASVHADIVNHWIDRKLLRLEKELERAHEKGWREEFYDLSCLKKLLSTPAERQRRLEEIPEVIPDAEESKVPEIESAASDPVQKDQGSRRNIAACLKDAKEISKDGAKQLPVSLEFIIDEPREAKQLPVSLKDIIDEPEEDAVEQLDDSLKVLVEESREGVTQQVADPLEVNIGESPQGACLRNDAACEVAFEAGDKALCNGGTPAPGMSTPLHSCQDGATTQVINLDNGKDENGSRHHDGGDQVVIVLDSDDDEDLHMEQPEPEQATCGAPEATNGIVARTHHAPETVDRNAAYTHHAPEVANEIATHTHNAAETVIGVTVPTVCASEDLDGITAPALTTSRAMTGVVAPARFTLNGITESVRMWYYVDPSGQEQGPHSMDQMRKWQQAGYFDPDFCVWKTGETQRKAILLVDAMRTTF